VFARAFGGVAFETGNAWYSEGGVALWLAPGESPDEERLGQVMQETAAPERLESIFSLFEKMGSHHPEEPYWYLPLIGVEPTMQGGGIGAALMRPVLERCDREGLKAYLEASNPRNIPFYEKLGFKATGSIQVADSPCITPMIREPQGS
jgi:GNAT superfamily N-acetyltransferase